MLFLRPWSDIGLRDLKELALIHFCESGSKVQVLMSREAANIWIASALVPTSSCPFGGQWLQDRTSLVIIACTIA